ncbi:glutathione S-transferase omega-1-like [Salarias fasciatus]|uniref:Glutathione S-transferase omega n=1 Tax=Salarias fasciatus TaxID=181472 RepID=A0A672J6L0_SALFA|nr:glutathione S-transferase omega-1-like [Salarias fasciatus]
MPSEKSLAKGSAAPGPVPADTIRIYSMRFCPFAQRTLLVLIAKGIKYEVVNVHLVDKPDWFLEKNPLGLVPTLETSAGEVIFESPITCDYLDEVYPGKKLLPPTPLEKAQQRMMLEQFKIPGYYYRITMGRKKGEDVSGLLSELKDSFTKLDAVLTKKKTKFFGGDSITMIDYMIWPWFERLEVFDVKQCVDSAPELKKWIERMLEDPAVKATAHSLENHKIFYESYVAGKPNYDIGL